MNDRARGITTNVGLIHGGTARNTVAEDCTIELDLRFADRASAGELEAKILALNHRGRTSQPP